MNERAGSRPGKSLEKNINLPFEPNVSTGGWKGGKKKSKLSQRWQGLAALPPSARMRSGKVVRTNTNEASLSDVETVSILLSSSAWGSPRGHGDRGAAFGCAAVLLTRLRRTFLAQGSRVTGVASAELECKDIVNLRNICTICGSFELPYKWSEATSSLTG